MDKRPGGKKKRCEGEDAGRARIRNVLLARGVAPARITDQLIDFWIVQDAKDQEEGRKAGYQIPNRMFFGSES